MSELESETAMRALVIAPQPFFSPRGTPFSVYHRTRVIAEQGIDVDLDVDALAKFLLWE